MAQKGQSQISLPKHKTISQNTNQFPKAQISFPKHKSISQNTNQFIKTRTSLPKHKPISRNTNQFRETQINGLGSCSVIIREGLERTHSKDFPRPTWRHLHASDNSSHAIIDSASPRPKMYWTPKEICKKETGF